MLLKIDKNIVTQLTRACTEYSEQIAYTAIGRDLTYRELNELSDHLAVYLLEYTELQSGDRVAVQLPNILQFPIAALAVLKADMVLVNTNPEYSEDELKHQLNDSGAKALIVYSGKALTFQAIQAETSVQTVIVTNIADLHPLIRRTTLHTLARFAAYQSCLEFPAFVKFRKALALGKKRIK